MPDISTLVEDIYGVFDKEVTVSPEDSRAFGEDLSRIVIEAVTTRKDNHLRLSNLGTPCRRKLWYSINCSELAERMPGSTRIKFLIGHVTEAVILFLARLSGHTVTDQQKTVEVHGVRGHIDGKIDGHLVDVKSASPYSFSKFKDGLKPEQDAFGYLSQLGAYAHSENERQASFVVVDKVLGHVHVDTHQLPEVDYVDKVADTQRMLESNEPPEREYTDVPEGASGNRKLGVACSYCDFKEVCWPGVKTYAYARGLVFLTVVKKPPRVSEA